MPVHCLHYHLHVLYVLPAGCRRRHSRRRYVTRAQGNRFHPPPHTFPPAPRTTPPFPAGKAVCSLPAGPKRPRSPSKESLHKQSVRSRRRCSPLEPWHAGQPRRGSRCSGAAEQHRAGLLSSSSWTGAWPGAAWFLCPLADRSTDPPAIRPADLSTACSPTTAADEDGVLVINRLPNLVRGKLDRSASSLLLLHPCDPTRHRARAFLEFQWLATGGSSSGFFLSRLFLV